MHRGNGIGSRGQAGQAECAVLARHREVRIADHAEVHPHPRMLIALDRHHDLRVRKRLTDWGGVGHLRAVPFRIVLRDGMDVVQRLVIVNEVHRLTDMTAATWGA